MRLNPSKRGSRVPVWVSAGFPLDHFTVGVFGTTRTVLERSSRQSRTVSGNDGYLVSPPHVSSYPSPHFEHEPKE